MPVRTGARMEAYAGNGAGLVHPDVKPAEG
jgi:hypothetical protein